MKLHDTVDEISGDNPVEQCQEPQASLPLPVQRIRTLREVEEEHVQLALRASNGNKKRAAEALGISRDTLYRKIAEFGITANAPVDRMTSGRRRT